MIKVSAKSDLDKQWPAIKARLAKELGDKLEAVGHKVADKIKATTNGVKFGKDDPLVSRKNDAKECTVMISVNNPNAIKEVRKQKVLERVLPTISGLLK